MGILGLAEIRMRVPDIQRTARGWDLASRRMAKGGYFWDLGNSIVLSMHEGASHMMTALLFRVQSLEKAKDALNERGLLGEHTTDEAQILPEAVEGLDFRLVQ